MRPYLKIFITILLLLPLTVFAQSTENSDSLFRVSDTIEINQEINGDVIALAKTIKINAKVNGDVIALAETIVINAVVAGDVRVMAKTVKINSKIEKNINIFAINTEISKDATLEKDLFISSREIKTTGVIKGFVNGDFTNAEIGGNINNNINITLQDTGKLVIYPETILNGNLTYTATQPTQIPDGVEIRGEIFYEEPPNEARKIDYFGKITSLFSLIALGMVVLFIDKKNTLRIAREIKSRPNKSFFYGILYFFAIPAISIILMFTIIGMPIALILLAFYAIILYASQVFAGIAIGDTFGKGKMDITQAMILGIIIIVILTSLPGIGGAFKLLAVFIGIGAIINTKRSSLKQINS